MSVTRASTHDKRHAYQTELDAPLAWAFAVALWGRSALLVAVGSEGPTLRLEVWQLRQDWVVRLRRLGGREWWSVWMGRRRTYRLR